MTTMTGSPKQGLFSSLTLGRASRNPQPPGETPTPTHPLLASSHSSLNLVADNTDAGPSQPITTRQSSWSAKTGAGEALSSLPYKPRQRYGGGLGSTGSVSSLPSSTPSNVPSNAMPTIKPATPTGMPAPPTTSTSFALPASASDALAAIEQSVFSSSSAAGASSATARLQLQSLKAAAQLIGLGNGSMGMSMIDAIFEKSQANRSKTTDRDDWSELLSVLMGGKAVILLPSTVSSFLPVTPHVLRDHVAVISPPIPSSSTSTKTTTDVSAAGGERESVSVVVTLSGLLGTLRGSSISFESSLPSESPLLAILRNSDLRNPSLSSLRPTHTSLPISPIAFPNYTLSDNNTLLPFPPFLKSGTPASAADGTDKEQEKAPTGKLGRIYPFASLFASSTPSASSSPKTPAPPVPSSPQSTAQASLAPERPLSPPLSSRDESSPYHQSLAVASAGETSSIHSDATAEGFHVTAYTVSRPIRYAEVHKALSKAVRAFIRDELSRLPDKIVDRVLVLALSGICPALAGSVGQDLSKANQSSDRDRSVGLDFRDPMLTGEKLQDFVEGVYDELMFHHRADSSHIFAEGSGSRRKASGTIPWSKGTGGETETEAEKRDRKERTRRAKEEVAEKEATEGAERVEGVLCRLLYNRLFSPLESDDGRHDEALASRIAALNMLDLSLDHLGLMTRPDEESDDGEGPIAEGLLIIIEQIGDELQKLSTPSCLTPKDKADVLIKAHRIVVDGLAELPPIELRPEGEPYRPSSRPPSHRPSPIPHVVSAMEAPIPPPTDTQEDFQFPSLAIPTSSPALSGSSSPTPLPTSSAASDPLTSIAETMEKTLIPLQQPAADSVPHFVLTDPAASSEIEKAMTDSVMTVTAPDMRRDVSAESSRPLKASTSGADLILPIIIFAVVKSNPPQLASQLMFLRRYRSAICLTGEASYAIVNLTAVVEFLEHVNLAELGLGDESNKVISVEDLSPIGLNYLDDGNADAASIASASSRLRGRVFQVSELAGSAAGSANKVITGVVDSSWTALRGLIIAQPAGTDGVEAGETAQAVASAPALRQRHPSSFSLASVTASVASIAAAAAASTTAARNRNRADSHASAMVPEHQWGGNQEMMEVASRPESIRETGEDHAIHSKESENTDEESSDREEEHQRRVSDARSIRSVSSMLDHEANRARDEAMERVSLNDRLASIGVLGKTGTAESAGPITSPEVVPSKQTSFLASLTSGRAVSASQGGRRGSMLSGPLSDSVNRSKGEGNASPSGSFSSLNASAANLGSVESPIERFMTCEAGDIRLSEVGILLRDYRRIGGIVAAHQAKQGVPFKSDA